MWNKQQQQQTKFIENDLVTRGGGGQEVQIFCYKINNNWGCNIEHDDYS